MDLPNQSLLAAWLNARNIKQGAFAALIPISKDVISKIVLGQRKPRQNVADRIEKLTDGFVKADKW